MKWLCLFCLVILWQYGAFISYHKYPSPLKSITYQLEPNKTGLKLQWDAVKSWDEKNPIVGYKVVIWEMKTGKKIVHRFVNGELKDEEVEDNTFPATVPVGDPKIFTVPLDKREVVYGYIKPHVWYQYSALAYTKAGEGPLSPVNGVMSVPKDNATETNN